jgi:hypothetical protein
MGTARLGKASGATNEIVMYDRDDTRVSCHVTSLVFGGSTESAEVGRCSLIRKIRKLASRLPYHSCCVYGGGGKTDGRETCFGR